MSSDETLSPEEKLLQLIQDEGEDKAEESEVAAPVAEATRAEAEESPVPVEEDGVDESSAEKDAKAQRKLKLARPAEGTADQEKTPDQEADAAAGAEGEEGTEATSESAEGRPSLALIGGKAGAPAAAAGGGLFSGRKMAGAGSSVGFHSNGIRTANRVLGLLVFLLMCGVIYEISSGLNSTSVSIMESPAGAGEGVDEQEVQTASVAAGLQPLSAYRDLSQGRDFWRPKDARPIQPQPKPEVAPDWQEYARNSLKLIMISPMPDPRQSEAMISDSANPQNYYIKIGDSITIEKQSVKVKSVSREGVVLSDGSAELKLQ